MQESALSWETSEAARRLWCLLPVQAQGKKPLIKAWPQAATCAVDRIENWARQFPGCNWGVATGMRSGIFILDIDGQAGEDALGAYALKGCHLPATLGVVTGGGRHLYFRYPVGRGVRNSAGKLSRGLDIRGNGGFAVLPPSVHASGARYSYQDPSLPVADAPVWLLDLVCSQRSMSVNFLHEGFRNDGLARVAGRWRRRGATIQEITARLLIENERRCEPALPEWEVVKIAKSVARYPVGGPDVLDSVWEKVRLEGHETTEAKFHAIIRHLEEALPGKPVALPLERIAGHIGCNWTLIRRYRRRAVDCGMLREVDPYIPHKKATLFRVLDSP